MLSNVLFISLISFVNGSWFYAFEYFYFIWKQDKSFKLVLLFDEHKTLKEFLDCIDDKYDYDINCRNNFIFIKKREILKNKFKKCLIVENTSASLVYNNLILAKNFVIISDESSRFLFQNYNALESRKNIKIFRTRNSVYTVKILYDIFKHLKKIDGNTYVSLLSKNYIKLDVFFKLIENHIKGDLLISTKFYFNTNLSDKFKTVICSKWMPDFHKRFSRYLYIETGYDDPFPRLPYESDYYKKENFYISDTTICNYFCIKPYIEKRMSLNDPVIGEMLC